MLCVNKRSALTLNQRAERFLNGLALHFIAPLFSYICFDWIELFAAWYFSVPITRVRL